MTSGTPDGVELVSRAWASYNADDIEGVLQVLDPDVVVHVPVELANSGTYRGHDEFVRWLAVWTEAWESFEMRVVDIVTVGDRHVVSHMNQIGIGRGSGIEVTGELGWLFEVRDGRCVHVGIRPSFEEALGDAREREGIGPDAA